MSINPSTAPGYVPSPQPAASYVPAVQAPPPERLGMKIPLLFGAIGALLAAIIFLFYQVNTLKTDLTKTQTSLLAELDKVRENSAVTTQTNMRTAESLRSQLEAARRQAHMAVGEARVEALKKVEETKQQLITAQEKASQQTSAQISEVKQGVDSATTKIGEVGTEVSTVKTEVATTKTELEKTIADLKRTTGDVDGHSTLIATNAKELVALRQLGERNYIEFNIHKAKQAQKVGDIMVTLKKADAKKNRYTIELTADDKTVEKKDRTVNEPLQFMTSKARQPYEIVVNDVKKDQIAGYLAVPKVQTGRN
jgi:chromosome segregation ATPase